MSYDDRVLGRKIPVKLFDAMGVHVMKCCRLTDVRHAHDIYVHGGMAGRRL